MAKRDTATSSKPRSKKQPELTIVIPAYREENRIGHTLDELAKFLETDGFFKNKGIEVIVVAADAPDNTHKIVASKRKLFTIFQFLNPGPKVGKGRDVQYGMQRASGEYIVYMDADLATPLYHLEEFYKACEEGDDVVVGTRNLLKHHPHLLRRAVSNIGNILFRIVTGLWIEDSQCGFKMFNERASRICFSKLSTMGWGFDMEILAIAKVNELKITTFRINDWESLPYSTFTDGLFRIIWRSLNDLSHIAVNRAKGTYNS